MAKHDKFWFNEQTGEIHVAKFRMAWPTLIQAEKIKTDPTSKPMFSVSGLLPKAVDLSYLRAEMTKGLQGLFGKEWQKKKGLKYCLQNTEDSEHLQEYASDFPHFLRMSANEGFPPFIFGPNAVLMERGRFNPAELYSGRWATAAGTLYPYDNTGKGIKFSLNRVQLLDHDEPLSIGRVATASGFEAVDTGGGAGDSSDLFGDEGDGPPNDKVPF